MSFWLHYDKQTPGPNHKTQQFYSPSPRSLFVRFTVIPLPRLLIKPRRDPRGRPRFAPRPDGLGLPVTSILLANGRGKAGKKKHEMRNITFGAKEHLGRCYEHRENDTRYMWKPHRNETVNFYSPWSINRKIQWRRLKWINISMVGGLINWTKC